MSLYECMSFSLQGSKIMNDQMVTWNDLSVWLTPTSIMNECVKILGEKCDVSLYCSKKYQKLVLSLKLNKRRLKLTLNYKNN